jgi:hypothetical protein
VSPSSHPDPPTDLALRRLIVRTFRGPWFRIHRLRRAAIFFGRSSVNRFDAPAGEFGVLYVGRDVRCAFIETFRHATGVRLLDRRELASRGIARVDVARPLRLVDLRGEGLARIGADAALTAGYDYGLAQRWAKALHDHRRRPDGIVYGARHHPTRTSAALFERVAPELSVVPMGAVDADPRRLGDLLDAYDFGLV